MTFIGTVAHPTMPRRMRRGSAGLGVRSKGSPKRRRLEQKEASASASASVTTAV